MIKRFLFFCCFMLVVFGCMAQYDHTPADTEEYYHNDHDDEDDIKGDTSVDIRDAALSADTLAAWKSNKKFAYAKNLAHLLRKQQEEENQKYRQRSVPAGSSFDGAGIAKWLSFLLWGLAIAVVIFILYKLFLSGGLFKMKRAQSGKAAEVVTEDERYIQQNFEELIHQACRLGDYRVATRYLFLKTLQRLSERSLIEFAIDKTNSKYLYEVPADKREDFAGLVLTYEYIWYGNSSVNKETYTGIESKFNAFLNRI